MKIIVGALWLVATLFLRGNPMGHKIVAYVGSVVAFVHAFALAGGMLLDWFTGRTSVEGGVNMAGFLVGCLVGLILGIIAGAFVSKNELAYWVVQLAVVGFIVFLPLFRW